MHKAHSDHLQDEASFTDTMRLDDAVMARAVAIIGLSCRLPGAVDAEQFWSNLANQVPGVTEVPPDRWDTKRYYDPRRVRGKNRSQSKWGGFMSDVGQFDAAFFGVSPREAEWMDPQQRIMLQLTWHCLEDAGYSAAELSGSRTGVYIGACNSDHKTQCETPTRTIEGHMSTGGHLFMIPNRISHFFNLHGPSLQVDTACASSLYAIHDAVAALRRGDCSYALAGGVSALLNHYYFVSFSETGMLSPDGQCKTFDSRANGYVRSEGAAMLLLKPLKTALADGDAIHGVLLGAAINHGGQVRTVTTPNPIAQANVIVSAHADAGIRPSSVAYMEAHGTGTPKGDPLEVDGLKLAFRTLAQQHGDTLAAHSCGLGSAKASIGHLEPVSGLAGAIKVLWSMKHRRLPGLMHFESLNPRIDFSHSPFYVVAQAQDWLAPLDADGKAWPLRAGVSSFGMGGANAHVVLQEAPAQPARALVSQPAYLVCLSGKTPEALAKRQSMLHEWLLKHRGEVTLSEVSMGLMLGRDHFAYRYVWVVSDLAELTQQLGAPFPHVDEWTAGVSAAVAPRAWQGMASEPDDEVRQQVLDLVSSLVTMASGGAVGSAEAGAGGTFSNLLAQLAPLYARGAAPDWRGLGGPVRPQRIRLPLYPFAQDQYRFRDIQASQEAGGHLHPLLHRNASTMAAQRFTASFQFGDFFLNDHQVHGVAVMPAAIYLEMAREALARSLDEPVTCWTLQDLVFLRPMMPGDRGLDVQVELARPGEDPVSESGIDRIEWRITSGGDGGVSLLHCQGVAVRQAHAGHSVDGRPGGNVVSLDVVRAQCARPLVDMGHCYDVFADRGLSYGPAMRPLTQVYFGESDGGPAGPAQAMVLAQLNLPSALQASREAFFLHPCLVDGALQACLAMVLCDEAGRTKAGGLVLPHVIEAVEMRGKVGDEVWVRARSRGQTASAANAGEPVFDIDMFDDSGLVCLRISGLHVRCLPSGERLHVAQSEPLLHVPAPISPIEQTEPAIDEAALVKKARAHFVRLMASTLRMAPDLVDVRAPLEQYGIDSVMAVELTSVLERHFGSLSKTLFFEYQTIAELTDYFLLVYRDKLVVMVGMAHRNDEVAQALVKPSPVTSMPRQAGLLAAGGAQARAAVPMLASASARSPLARADEGPLDVAIVGLAGRYPGARDVQAFWRNLQAGRDGVTEIPVSRWDGERFFDARKGQAGKSYSKWGGFIDGADEFDPLFFNISPREAHAIDPQERVFLQCAYAAIEDAGYTRENLASSTSTTRNRPGTVGVYVGAMWQEYQLYGAQSQARGGSLALPGNSASIANRVSYCLNLQGPSLTVDTMCSSSLTAIHLACHGLLQGDCSVAIAGGVNLTVHPNKYLVLSQGQFVSSEGVCRSFGQGGDGYVPAEGVGAVVLKPLQQAILDGDHIYGVIKGTAINHGGKTNGYSVPNPNAQAQVVGRAIEQSGVHPRAISYVEAHGTGTSLGDPIEMAGLSKAFGKGTADKRYCAIGSSKSNIGHAESAAGIAGLTKVLLQMQHAQLVPSLHSDVLNTNIDFDDTPFVLQRHLGEWARPVLDLPSHDGEAPRVAGLSSFGAGGSNAHLIVQEHIEAPTALDEDVGDGHVHLIVLSARHADGLRSRVADVLAFLTEPSRPRLRMLDVAYTLQVGREPMSIRLACEASSFMELANKLQDWLNNAHEPDAVWEGAVRRDKVLLASLSEDGTMRQEVENWLDTRQWPRLAQVWVMGLECDWTRLYGQSSDARRVSLPTYPFARDRYWVDGAEALVHAPGDANVNGDAAARLHPLLHANVSTLDKQCFVARFNVGDFFLHDHVVKGRHVLPAAVQLEMAREAVRLSAPSSGPVCLQRVVFAHPVVVDESCREVRVELVRRGDHGIDFVLSSISGDRTVVHTRGHAQTLPSGSGAGLASLDIAALQARCNASMDASTCYAMFEGMGLAYGPRMRALQSVQTSPSFVLARLALPEGLGQVPPCVVLHPSMLDGALQACIGLLAVPGQGAPCMALPYALDELRIMAPVPAQAWAWVRQVEAHGDVLKADIDLSDSHGQLCVRVQGLSLRLLAFGEAEAGRHDHASGARTLMARLAWQPLPNARTASSSIAIEGAGEARHIVGWSACLLPDAHARQQFEFRLKAVWPNATSVCLAQRAHGGLTADVAADYGQDAQRLMAELRELMALPSPTESRVTLLLPLGDVPSLWMGLSGMLGSAQLEKRGLHTQVVMLPQAVTHGATLCDMLQAAQQQDARIVRIFATGAQASEVEMASLCAVEFAPPPETAWSWREGGVYLITGGAGGLGRLVAQAIARRSRGVTLILTGRTPLHAATGGAAGDLPSFVASLQTLGARAEYHALDICDERATRDLVTQVVAQHGRLDGVIHSAGLLRDGLLQTKKAEDLHAVLAPKVQGLLSLDAATAHLPLDCFVMFSSVASLIGNAGQSNYAAANGFMDSFAVLREGWAKAGQRHGRSLSIHWPLWAQGGMNLDERGQRRLRQTTGLVPLPSEAGIEALHQALASGEHRVAVLHGDDDRLRAFFSLHPAPVPAPGMAAEMPSKSDGARVAAPSVAATSALPQHLSLLLRQAISSLLQIDPAYIDADTEFAEFGFDSVSLAAFATAINEQCCLDLHPAQFYETTTMAALVAALVDEHGAHLMVQLGLHSDDAKSEAARQAWGHTSAPTLSEGWPEAPHAETLASDADADKGVAPRASERRQVPVAIIGMSGRFPQADSLDALWTHLRVGHDCIEEIPPQRWDHHQWSQASLGMGVGSRSAWGGFIHGAEAFDPLFFHIAPREASAMDPQERVFLETCWHTLEDSGWTRERLRQACDGRVGVYVGVTDAFAAHVERQPLDEDEAVALSSASSVANRVSQFMGFEGPSLAIDTMCSSSGMALHLACKDLAHGECEAALVGGVNLTMRPDKYLALSRLQLAGSHAGCRSFASGDGYLPAEAVGAVLLKPLARAMADGDRVLGVIAGSACVHTGQANGFATPSVESQVKVMRECLRHAGVDAAQVDYMEAAANGSALGDMVEWRAIQKVLGPTQASRDEPCVLGAVKSNIGHPETASTMAQLAKVLLQLRHEQWAPTIRQHEVNADLRLHDAPFAWLSQVTPWCSGNAPKRTLINSFGAGGSYVSLLIEACPAKPRALDKRPIEPESEIFLLSAATMDQLRVHATQMLAALAEHPDVPLRAVSHTLCHGREALPVRLAFVAQTHDQVLAALGQFCRPASTGLSPTVHVSDDDGTRAVWKRMLAGRHAENWMRELFADRELDRLACLWVYGARVPWEMLAPAGAMQMVPLPPYPFARDLMPARDVQAPNASRPGAAIPMTQARPAPVATPSGCSDGRSWPQVLAGLVGDTLRLDAVRVAAHVPLKQFGFTSLDAVSLQHKLQAMLECDVPLATLNSHETTLSGLAAYLQPAWDAVSGRRAPEYAVVSHGQAGGTAAELGHALIETDLQARFDPFPLAALQEAFLAGRGLQGHAGGSARLYLELDVPAPLDMAVLNQSWQQMMARHDMLRVRFTADGRQQVQSEVPKYWIKVVDLTDSRERARVGNLRDRMALQDLDPARWPLFDIRVARHADDRQTVHFCIDELIADGYSVELLLREWAHAYRALGGESTGGALPALTLQFRDCQMASQTEPRRIQSQRALSYWLNKLAHGVPAGPKLPVQASASALAKRYRRRLSDRLSAAQWQALQARADACGVSPTVLLLGCFATVLHAAGGGEPFSLLLTFFNRLPVHPQIKSVVGPMISTLVFALDGRPADGDAMSHLRRIQEALWTDMDHLSASGTQVLRELKARKIVSGGFMLPVVFTSLLNSGVDERDAPLLGELAYMVNLTPQVDLDHQVRERQGMLEVSWDVAVACYPLDFMETLFKAYMQLLRDTLEIGLDQAHVAMDMARFNHADAWQTSFSCPPDPGNAHVAFGLTDVQQAYAFARHGDSEGVSACLAYQEIDVAGLDVTRLERSWHALQAAHPMLRASIGGEGLQHIAPTRPLSRFEVQALHQLPVEHQHQRLASTRMDMLRDPPELGAWPHYQIRVSMLGSGRGRVHVCIDMLMADLASIRMLLDQWLTLYRDDLMTCASPGLTFRDYRLAVAGLVSQPCHQRSMDYWQKKFEQLPGGPVRKTTARTRHSGVMPSHCSLRRTLASWPALKERAKAHGVSTHAVLLTAYMEALASGHEAQPFSVVVPGWRRYPVHPDVAQVVGDFTTLSWVSRSPAALPFVERVGLVESQWCADLEQGPVGGLAVLRRMGASLGPQGRVPLKFPIVFTEPVAQARSLGDDIVWGEFVSQTPDVHIDNISFENEETLECAWEFSLEVYDVDTVERMFVAYVHLLEDLARTDANWTQVPSVLLRQRDGTWCLP